MTESVQIDSTVPMPKMREYRRRLADEDRAAILAMLPGQSFAVAPETARTAAAFARRNGISLTQAKQPDGSIRLWRKA